MASSKRAPSKRGRNRSSTDGSRPVRGRRAGLHRAGLRPAGFAHARGNSEICALVSDDPKKLRELGRRYGVDHLYGYEDYERGLEESGADAAYIALPNDMHREFTERAADVGVHVLCEKPMALSVSDCESMIAAAERNEVKLMIAYRLHFQKANLAAIEALQAGKLGKPRLFNSVFTMDVKDPDNIRLKRERGGGTLWDIGIYCINAARYLFRAEPLEAFAWIANSGDRRFAEVEEMTGAILRFPEERLASFTVSFGAADVGFYRVVGTKGDLHLDSAYGEDVPQDRPVRARAGPFLGVHADGSRAASLGPRGPRRRAGHRGAVPVGGGRHAHEAG